MDLDYTNDPANLSSINLQSAEDKNSVNSHEDDSYVEGATPSAKQPGGDESPTNSPVHPKGPSGNLAFRNIELEQDTRTKIVHQNQTNLGTKFH